MGASVLQALVEAVESMSSLARQREEVYAEVDERDCAPDFEEEILPTGLLRRVYADGRVRTENPVSGVMQELRPDGSLLVSLPEGKVIYQCYPGEPLLAYFCGRTPVMARVSRVHMRPQEEPILAYHFSDPAGHTLVEVETLRYFRLSLAA
ncbi:MAG: hypothetical protein AB1758_21995 [Candidatus Eremiobacterota bacterium]